MVIRIQDGPFELRYELQRNGTFRLVEFTENQPVRFMEGVPPQTALENFITVANHKIEFNMEEFAKEHGEELRRDTRLDSGDGGEGR